MAQHAKKAERGSMPMKNSIRLAKKAEKIILRANDEENRGLLLHETEDLNRLAHQYVGVCKDAVCAGTESSHAASLTFKQIGNQLVKNINRACAENVDICKQAYKCNSANDIAAWYQKLWQQTMTRYCDEASAICRTLFDNYNKIMGPLQQHTTIASDKLRKAIAV